jgi:murein DD-endopeptidase MepM/ murein hydrolase activator NlpD
MLSPPDIPAGISNIRLGNIEAYRGRTDPEAMKAVAREMEAMFAYELIKVMRETSNASSQGALGADTYMSLFDMELSRLFAERGIGLQEALSRGLSSAAGIEGPPEAEQKPREESGPQAQKPGFGVILPDLDNPRISSAYGFRTDPLSGERRFHRGVDIPAPEGTDIHAVRKGTVAFSGVQNGYGNVVIIDHGDGFTTKYAHNKANLVKEGDRVGAGAVIAQAGSTGRSTGPHIHFEVLYQGKDVSPGTLLSMR